MIFCLNSTHMHGEELQCVIHFIAYLIQTCVGWKMKLNFSITTRKSRSAIYFFRKMDILHETWNEERHLMKIFYPHHCSPFAQRKWCRIFRTLTRRSSRLVQWNVYFSFFHMERASKGVTLFTRKLDFLISIAFTRSLAFFYQSDGRVEGNWV